MILYTPEEAVAEIRKAHALFFPDNGKYPTREDVEKFAAKVWAILDFTEKPKETVLIRL